MLVSTFNAVDETPTTKSPSVVQVPNTVSQDSRESTGTVELVSILTQFVMLSTYADAPQ